MAVYLNKKTLFDVSKQIIKFKKSIVLTHGAFDLFHIGHSELLKVAKKMDDYLIVGIDSDDRIRKYKGDIRPIIPFEQRIEILLENKSVDFVFAINDSLDLTNNYFIDLYESLNLNTVTYGRKFGFEKDILERKNYFDGRIRFEKIIHRYDNLQSTTGIINKIISNI